MLYEITVPQFAKMLKNLNAILGKAATLAETKKFDSAVLLNSRLAPDMLPLTKQIQIACDSAKLCAARLSGVTAPTHDDNETTLVQLTTRIDDVIKFLNQIPADSFKGAETKQITQPRWEGKYLTGWEYTLQHAIPNVYFHITTAYAILRHNGVEIGKKDYLGELPYKK